MRDSKSLEVDFVNIMANKQIYYINFFFCLFTSFKISY